MPPAAHALLGASSAERWLACPPSVRLSEKFPDTAGVFAREGTLAHSLAELKVRSYFTVMTKSAYTRAYNKIRKDELFSTEMDNVTDAYLDYIKDCAMQFPAPPTVACEVKVNFSGYVPDGFGTADLVMIGGNTLRVIDFKYGKGVRVEATGNPQMRLYALGALLKYNTLFDIDSVRMTIFQPRLSGVQSSDEITVKELLEWAEKYVKPRAKLAYKGEGEFAPSEEVCKFCRAKAQCKARADKNLKLFDEAPDAMLLTPEEAGAILEKAADIQAWLTDLEGLVSSTLLSGQPVTGWKMVEGRSNRKFADELKVVEAMKSAGYDESLLYERKLITLTQMEKDFGKKAVAETLGELIVKPQGKPTLAPAKDKRPELKPEEQLLAEFDK